MFLKLKKKKKIGLALGSGGAKGMAHLGVLKAFEEFGIEFDVVAGTSIGSIVGAMYSKGYSVTDTRELIKRLDYKNIAISLLVGGTFNPIKKIISDALGTEEFSDLKKPFAAVATDVSNGAEVILRGGNLIDALMASSAMPPFFKAVKIDDSILADGAFVNAVPADIAKSMGADVVIGVALSEYSEDKTMDFLTTSGDVLTLSQNGFKSCDVLLTPSLNGYMATDVLKTEDMYEIGYDCAKAHIEEILTLVNSKKGVKFT